MYLIVVITWVNLIVKIVCELLENESDPLEQTDLQRFNKCTLRLVEAHDMFRNVSTNRFIFLLLVYFFQ